MEGIERDRWIRNKWLQKWNDFGCQLTVVAASPLQQHNSVWRTVRICFVGDVITMRSKTSLSCISSWSKIQCQCSAIKLMTPTFPENLTLYSFFTEKNIVFAKLMCCYSESRKFCISKRFKTASSCEEQPNANVHDCTISVAMCYIYTY